MECEQQDDRHEQHRKQRYGQVVLLKRALKIIAVCALADGHDLVGRVVLLRDDMNAVKEGEGIFSLLRQLQRDEHAAVVLALQLCAGKGELVVKLADHGLLIVLKRQVAALGTVVQKQKQIYERGGVALRGLLHFVLIAVRAGVVGKERLRHRLIHVGERGKLRSRHAVAKEVAVHALNGGEAHRALDLRARAELSQKRLFLFVVAARHDQRERIALAEAVADGLLLDLGLVLARRGDQGVAVSKIHVPVNGKRSDEHGDKQDRNDEPRAVGKPAHERDLRHEAAVTRAVHRLAEGDKQRRHEEEHRQQAACNGFDEDKAQIRAEAELHERHGRETGDRRKAAREDLGDRGGKRLLHGGTHGKRRVLLLVAVAEDNRIVHAQRELQNHRHRVGYKRNAPEDEVRALLQNRGEQERQDEYGNLGIRLRGEDQHRHDYRRDDYADAHHLFHEVDAHAGADVGLDVDRLAVKKRADVFVGRLGCFIRGSGREGDVIERVPIGIVLIGKIKAHERDAIDVGDPVCQGLRLIGGDVVRHDLRSGVACKFILHDRNALARLAFSVQIAREAVVHLDPRHGNHAEGQHGDAQQQYDFPTAHDGV